MIFGNVPIEIAEGAVLAHAVPCSSGRLAKGRRLSAADVHALLGDGVKSVVAVRLEEGDMPEDEAAGLLAATLDCGSLRLSPASTGRVNVYATENGVFVADKAVVDRFNRVDPAITLACLADHVAVLAGDMVATIKIIPLAVAGEKVRAALAVLSAAVPFAVKPYLAHAVTLIATQLPSLKTSVMDKTARLLGQRLAPSASRLTGEIRVDHSAQTVAKAIREVVEGASEGPAMIIVFGASAVCDPGDVVPQSIRLAGGRVEQVGLPVDPGNLLVLGYVGDVPVIGAPGCARSPKENGFDWILSRLLAGERPSPEDMTGLGVGGLLMEIPTRPLPREKLNATQAPAQNVVVVVLAAGRASRMGAGGPHKLLAEFDGVPLVRRAAEAALGAKPDGLVTVTGYRHEEIVACLDGLDSETVFNPDYASGMASSLRAGLAAPAARDADGVLVMLADMPGVTATDVATLISAFRAAGGRAIVRAVADGKRGNPVVLPRMTFGALMKLEGDVGARQIIETSGLEVIDVEIGEAAHRDVDTVEAVLAAGGVLKG
ncbi:MAG: NTP transferase domain-containing protein [Allorhizobium sp.]